MDPPLKTYHEWLGEVPQKFANLKSLRHRILSLVCADVDNGWSRVRSRCDAFLAIGGLPAGERLPGNQMQIKKSTSHILVLEVKLNLAML